MNELHQALARKAELYRERHVDAIKKAIVLNDWIDLSVPEIYFFLKQSTGFQFKFAEIDQALFELANADELKERETS